MKFEWQIERMGQGRVALFSQLIKTSQASGAGNNSSALGASDRTKGASAERVLLHMAHGGGRGETLRLPAGQSFDESGGRPAGDQREDHDASACGFDRAPLVCVEGVQRVIAAFDIDIGLSQGQEPDSSGLRKDANRIDASEGGQDHGAVGFGVDGAGRTFEGADGCVAVEPDQQGVAEVAGGFEVLDVAGMEDIEATVRDDDARMALALPGAPGVEVVQGHDFFGGAMHAGITMAENGAEGNPSEAWTASWQGAAGCAAGVVKRLHVWA